jgi:hypothetical protein
MTAIGYAPPRRGKPDPSQASAEFFGIRVQSAINGLGQLPSPST